MPSFSKRKRHRRDMRCVLFPEDVKQTFSKRASCDQSKTTKSWESCGDTFLAAAAAAFKNNKATERSNRVMQQLAQPSTSATSSNSQSLALSHETEDKDAVHIAWTSSEEEQSDSEYQLQLPHRTKKASQRCRPNTCPTVSAFVRYQNTGADTDEHPTIDSESEHEDDCTSKEQIPMVVAEISDYTSDSEEAPDSIQVTSPALEQTEYQKRSVSEWVRSAQTLLQTPQKQIDKTSKTPEDSGKKRNRFERRGLAERLNRLQCRQRSAISFWRHQSSRITKGPGPDGTASGSGSGLLSALDRPGDLVLHIKKMYEVCGMQAALCERPAETEPCVALFNKEVATHLAPAAGDSICVHPPWQSLIVEQYQHPIILNTHFSQKILAETIQNISMSTSGILSPKKMRPYTLTRCLWKRIHNHKSSNTLNPNKQNWKDSESAFESLLEAIEACDSVCGPVVVVVQRVYLQSVTTYPHTSTLRHRSKYLPKSSLQPHIGRLCILVQDVYGIFSEVELQYVSSEEELKYWLKQLQGKLCVLRGLKVVQRLTRERCTELFSLIDSLWPPLVPLQVHSNSSCCQVPAPSFCYRLAGQQGCVLRQHESSLYHPPVIQTIREILQGKPTGQRCSFWATLLYKKEQSKGERDVLLFVTDASLQDEQSSWISYRTLPLYVNSSCLQLTSISQSIINPQHRPMLLFRDAIVEQGKIFFCGQSVVLLDSEHICQNSSLTQSILLDELKPESPACSLCTLTGVVVDVDENSSFSWLICSQCGSDFLEAGQNEQNTFVCVTCGVVGKPTTKIQLEVFLSCPSLSEYTVKIKLQQRTIQSLLTGYTQGYEVERVLGKKVAILSAFIHVVSRGSTLWMGLEEITL